MPNQKRWECEEPLMMDWIGYVAGWIEDVAIVVLVFVAVALITAVVIVSVGGWQ